MRFAETLMRWGLRLIVVFAGYSAAFNRKAVPVALSLLCRAELAPLPLP
jgi:hypothetical protein